MKAFTGNCRTPRTRISQRWRLLRKRPAQSWYIHPWRPGTCRSSWCLAKARGAAINYGHEGVGTIAQLAVQLLRMQTGVVVTSVAYKGTSPAINDTIAGQTHFMITSTLTVQPVVKSGRLRALAVTSPRRSKAFPDLPTAIEAGLPNYVVLGWAGVFAPARVPRVLIDRINTAINEGLADAVTLERLLASGSEPSAMSAAEFTRFTQAEAARWAGVVKEARISPE